MHNRRVKYIVPLVYFCIQTSFVIEQNRFPRDLWCIALCTMLISFMCFKCSYMTGTAANVEGDGGSEAPGEGEDS